MFFFNESDTLGDSEFNIYGEWVGNTPSIQPTYFPTSNPTYGGGGGGSSINWNNIWNNIFGVGSQAIAAWGNNPTQQVGNYGTVGIGQGYSPAAIQQANAQLQAQIAAQTINSGGIRTNPAGVGGANSLDGIFNSITSTVSANPMIFLGLGVGAYLLFRDPPRRR